MPPTMGAAIWLHDIRADAGLPQAGRDALIAEAVHPGIVPWQQACCPRGSRQAKAGAQAQRTTAANTPIVLPLPMRIVYLDRLTQKHPLPRIGSQ